jgi:hypothetical protein
LPWWRRANGEEIGQKILSRCHGLVALMSTVTEAADASFSSSLSPSPKFKLDCRQLPGKWKIERGDETD